MNARKNRAAGLRRSVEFLESRELLATLLGTPVSATPGVEFDGQLAYFANLSTDFSPGAVQINWGDKTPLDTSTGQIVSPLPVDQGVFDVVEGSHTYAQAGSYTVTLTVDNEKSTPPSVSTTVTATVEPGAITILPNTASGTAGVPLSAGNSGAPVVLANFLDSTLSDTASGYAALIDWGDGHTSAGKVAGSNGVFTVSGDHTYAAANTYAVTVTVVGYGQNVSTTGAVSIATAGSGSSSGVLPYKLKPLPIVQVAGQPTSSPLATFTDPITTDSASAFTAFINWGDGDTGLGSLSGGNGAFTVNGAYTYPNPGTYTVNVTVTNNATGQTANTTATANVVNTNSATANPFAFSIALASLPANGANASSGFTNTNRPTFRGTATPFAIVQLAANLIGVDASTSLGQAVANGSGQWSLAVGPLADGAYEVTATVTPAGGSPSQMTNPASSSNPLDEFTIDTSAPKVAAVTLRRRLGEVVVSYRPGISGMNSATILNPANYTFIGPKAPVFHPASVTPLSTSTSIASAPATVVLNMGNTAKARRMVRQLIFSSSSITNNAGTGLQVQGSSLTFALSTATVKKAVARPSRT